MEGHVHRNEHVGRHRDSGREDRRVRFGRPTLAMVTAAQRAAKALEAKADVLYPVWGNSVHRLQELVISRLR